MSDIVVKIRESSLVRPVEKTSPTRSTIPLSDLDQLYYERRSTLLYFYNNKNYNNSSSLAVDDHIHNLKTALAKTLVLYYPVAGRLSRAENGGEERLEIKCNDEGVLFVVGETKSHIEDLGDFTDSSLLISNLIPPTPDYSAGISSFPLFVFQTHHIKEIESRERVHTVKGKKRDMEIIINVKERSMVKPSEKTPRRQLWLSVLDQINNLTHNSVIYFFRSSSSNNNNNFFDANILKHSLSKVLVPFYPIAGRLVRPIQVHGGGPGHHPRTEIDCNDEGVLFVTAETTAVIDDFGDFAPTPQLRRLTPTVDYSLGISSYPLLLIQMVTMKVKERSMVKPSEKTPRRRLWLSVLDQMNNPSHNQVLVPFYPIAGRLVRPVHVHELGGQGHRSQTEIDCNEKGVLFVTAETTAVIDDFSDFAPTPQLRSLTPTVDYSLGISSYPLLLIQVKERSLVKPLENGLCRPISIPLSNLDLLYEEVRKGSKSTGLYFYNNPNQEVPTSTHNFFDSSLLKNSLAEVLNLFYPVAGRLGHDHNHRLQINCNDDGVLFVVAETSSHIHELGDFTSSSDLSKLSPPASDYYSTEISSIPLLALQ
ncbi:hypothetical protein G4B88_003981, partial [Cannabis sativa]